ncbi:hypothetical protein HMPREF9412_0642 [Paenibacillus sp. HGF5]|nr:hypothetical protein HMPREF9412_0642 [Paenibacillus sp. HGF5]
MKASKISDKGQLIMKHIQKHDDPYVARTSCFYFLLENPVIYP